MGCELQLVTVNVNPAVVIHVDALSKQWTGDRR